MRDSSGSSAGSLGYRSAAMRNCSSHASSIWRMASKTSKRADGSCAPGFPGSDAPQDASFRGLAGVGATRRERNHSRANPSELEKSALCSRSARRRGKTRPEEACEGSGRCGRKSHPIRLVAFFLSTRLASELRPLPGLPEQPRNLGVDLLALPDVRHASGEI
jgi:hypothetical protein